MAVGKITNGVAEIKVDNVVLGYTLEGSINLLTEDNTTVTSWEAEEVDDPIFTRRSGSKIFGIEFQVADPVQATLVKLFGGTQSGSDVKVDGISNILKGVPFELTPEQGWGISATSVDVSSRPSDNMGKNSLFGIIVNVTFNEGFTFVDADGAGT